MKAIIHIGIEKTGTTTIQEFLHQNRENLAKKGVAYLRTGGQRNNRAIAAYCMADDAVDKYIRSQGIVSKSKREEWKAKLNRELDDEIRSLDKKISTVIISSEHFHSRLSSPEEVRNLFNLLKPYFAAAKIVVYLRRQDEVEVSLYSTICRSGGARTSVLRNNLSPNNAYYNYYNLLDRWANAFGKSNIVARLFDKKKFISGDLLHDFIHAGGIAWSEEFVVPERLNEKLSGQVQGAIRMFNVSFPKFIDDKRSLLNDKLRGYLISELEKKYKGRERLPSKKEAVEFYDKFSESNKKLARQYFSSENIFSEDFTNYPEDAQQDDLSDELINDILYHISSFMGNYLFIPRDRLNNINMKEQGAALNDIARNYVPDYPEIANFLQQEAEKYRKKCQ